ncbi:hypothetical protein GAO09_16100 [Rhizobiales bacterium RZME27]|jgi:hypothetical protein|uniref:Uncharacterized protein n=1 Tax=Endobacterium cereale TaxID=2663029 RepID=A0A6A8ACE2_9HYPH|nr:hypothetical protein [Endobacterium cereale]MEB2847024.1 hypothetical protein [Endobacterium cereale]MQY47558.1 hypothetical protein [Endobacterium cereale]
MFYPDGRLARLGDRVRLGGRDGIVVFSIDTDEFSECFPREDWADYGEGIMVDLAGIGLILCIEPDEDLEFVASEAES